MFRREYKIPVYFVCVNGQFSGYAKACAGDWRGNGWKWIRGEDRQLVGGENGKKPVLEDEGWKWLKGGWSCLDE